MNRLTEAERDQLLTPCDCGHSINDHGSLDTCWTCSDDNQECAYYFEDLLTARIGAIVAARLASVKALADEWDGLLHERGPDVPPPTVTRCVDALRAVLKGEN